MYLSEIKAEFMETRSDFENAFHMLRNILLRY